MRIGQSERWMIRCACNGRGRERARRGRMLIEAGAETKEQAVDRIRRMNQKAREKRKRNKEEEKEE